MVKASSVKSLQIQKTTHAQSKINFVYINPSVPHNSDDFILIDGVYIYAFKIDTQVPSSSIAVSKIQREYMNKALLSGDKLEIDFIDKKFIENIGLIKLGIEMINMSNVDIDASSLKEAIKSTYIGFPFNKFQKLYITLPTHEDTVFVLTVLDIISGDAQPHGVLQDSTDISISSTSTRVNITNNISENLLLDPNFSFDHLGIGGLKKEFEQMFRRAFVQRLFDPAVMKKMGIPHVKGIMLHGPPGTGKTLIARKLGSLLDTRPPKVVNGPEILDKYVGQSEENIRKLFKEAEDEWKAKKEGSQLHIIIFDEIDAICKRRGSSGPSGVGDQVVNQLLSKIDGVESLDNILVIGMTNRLDLIDDALLRPGRFEIHLEISLPDESSRLEIFQIHTKQMSSNDYLDKGIDFENLAKLSKNYTGAEIAAVVRNASSFALERKVRSEEGNKLVADENILITMDDMLRALNETKPAFGINDEDFQMFNKVFYETENNLLAIEVGKTYITTLRSTNLYNTGSLLFHGSNGCGKTTIAVKIALESMFPLVRMIGPGHMVGMSDSEKVNYIKDKFMEARKSEEAIIILDDIEGLIEYVGIGPRFSNPILHALKIFVKAESKSKLFVLGTTAMPDVLKEAGLYDCFSHAFQISNIGRGDYKRLCEQNSEFRNVNFVEEMPLKSVMTELSQPDMSMK